MNALVFDIGATKTRIAYTENGEFFETPEVLQTPSDYTEGLKLFIDTAEKLAKKREIKVLCGGMSRNVGNWVYENLEKDLRDHFRVKVFLENDAAIVGLGEAVYGAGRGQKIVAYITVSTGVGGARLIDGKIDEYAIGFEPGKQILDVDTGETLESLVSGKSLSVKTGKHPKEVKDQNIWSDISRFLAVGLNNIAVEWSPNVIVLGGSMITGDPAIPLDKTEEYLKEILKIYPEIPAIKKAELGDFGGLYGALAYLKQKHI